MAELQVWEVKEPYVHVQCKLSEGPFYVEETNSLRFVDIPKGNIHTVDLAKGPSSLQTLTLDSTVGVTADIESVDPRDKILVGLKYGPAVLDCKTGQSTYIRRFSDAVTSTKIDFERTRANDGAADPHGRFWLGSMTTFDIGEFQPEGGLFLFDGDKTPELVRPNLTIPNALGFSPDGRTMYFTHSSAKTVFGFDYAEEDGKLSNERVVYQHDGPGEPDGFRVDTEGYIWHAVYGLGKVLKIDPATGKVVGEVRLPTLNITCTQFVGEDLFITTGQDASGEGGPVSKELGGAVFRVHVGSKGLPLYKYKLKKN